MSKPIPLAVLCSDLHLSIKPPLARSTEEDWFAVMQRVLTEIDGVAGDLPIICAGDIFDKWNAPAELINFALEYLPDMYAIPGQHDLPFHNYADMKRSAFGTLVAAEKITLLNPGSQPFDDEMNGNSEEGYPTLVVHAFPWSFELKPIKRDRDTNEIHLAVVHKYIWHDEAKYEGALEQDNIKSFRGLLRGYDAAVVGDNHQFFETKMGDCIVWNNGTVMRRKIDEIKYKPRIGILMSDGSITPHFLNTKQDVFISKDEIKVLETEGFNIRQFVSELDKLGSNALDFREAVEGYLKTYQVSKGAKKIILESLENES